MNDMSTWAPGGGEESLQEQVLMMVVRRNLHIVQG